MQRFGIGFCLIILLISCATTPPSRVTSYTAEQRYVFPYDMSQWMCEEYFEQMKKNGTYNTLVETLEIRPHKRFREADHRHLKLIPREFIPLERIEEPLFYHKIHRDAYKDLLKLIFAARKAGWDLRAQPGLTKSVRLRHLKKGPLYGTPLSDKTKKES